MASLSHLTNCVLLSHVLLTSDKSLTIPRDYQLTTLVLTNNATVNKVFSPLTFACFQVTKTEHKPFPTDLSWQPIPGIYLVHHLALEQRLLKTFIPNSACLDRWLEDRCQSTPALTVTALTIQTFREIPASTPGIVLLSYSYLSLYSTFHLALAGKSRKFFWNIIAN